MTNIAPDYQTPSRMALKGKAVPLPNDLAGKAVLDIGCDMGAWSFMAADRGASHVLGIDRNRVVRGAGFVDLIDLNRRRAAEMDKIGCQFSKFELGRQWHEAFTFPNKSSFAPRRFDVVLMLSVYHHIYEAAGGDHAPIWFWLRRQIEDDGVLLWEGPCDDSDPVVRANVAQKSQAGYTLDAIIGAGNQWFSAEYIGPALHEPTRDVWRFRPKARQLKSAPVIAFSGAGGAAAAFEYANGRRMDEIEKALGVRPVSGSLNLQIRGQPFDWHSGYYRASMLDVVERPKLDGDWRSRWARFYPVLLNGHDAFVFRFEDEHYPQNFIEVIGPERYRETTAEPLTLQW